MSKAIEEILAPKPEARPRIYAYSISDEAHKGLLKVGQTTRNVKQRVAEQLKTAAIKNYIIVLDEPAEREDGSRLHFTARSRLDTPVDVRYYQNGGILHTVLRDLLTKSAKA